MAENPRNVPANSDHRVSDADRESTTELLRQATGEGRLGFDEMETRVSAVYAAKTRGELDVLTADLPALQSPDVPDLTLRTKSGVVKKGGHWIVPRRITAECHSGSIKIDFTGADCTFPEVSMAVAVKSGSIVLIVPEGWGVDLDDTDCRSGVVANKVRVRRVPGMPTVRVSGRVTSGTITARNPRRSLTEWLFRREPKKQ